MPDRIIVAGAGLGGLSAAIALRQQGLDVTVVERATEFSRSAGAGLTVTAPGIAAFDALGLKQAITDLSDPVPATPLIHHQTGEVFHTRAVPNLDKDAAPEGPNRFVPRVTHRADVHQLLLGAALDAGATILTGAHLVGFDQDEGGVRVMLADGRTLDAAILIGADGLRSRVRAQLRGESEPDHTGVVAWRALVPVERVREQLGGFGIAIHFGPTAHFMRYLVRHGTMLNCVCLVKTDIHAKDGWATPSTNAELKSVLPGWHHGLLDLIDRIPDGMLYKWPLMDRAPIAEWVEGRVALLGDAAHPMLPYYGIGATIAMEDAVVLGRAMAAASDPIAGLTLYERSRVERANRAQAESRRLGETYMGGGVLDIITQPLMDWGLYAYDPRTAPLG